MTDLFKHDMAVIDANVALMNAQATTEHYELAAWQFFSRFGDLYDAAATEQHKTQLTEKFAKVAIAAIKSIPVQETSEKAFAVTCVVEGITNGLIFKDIPVRARTKENISKAFAATSKKLYSKKRAYTASRRRLHSQRLTCEDRLKTI